MKRYRAIFWACAAALAATAAGAQTPPARTRVEGLEGDSLYTVLLSREAALNKSQDSLATLMQGMRSAFGAGAQDASARAALAERLIGMENELFAIRNRLGAVAGRINALEQEYIIRSMSAPAADPGPAVAGGAGGDTPPTVFSADLIRNDWFRRNLTAEEYAQLQRSADLAAERDELVAEFRALHARLVALKAAYEAATAPYAADSIFGRARAEAARLDGIERRFEAAWAEPYAQEQYLYAYLLDKLNRTDELQALHEQARDAAAFDPAEVFSPVFAAYPARRALLVDYQSALAAALDLSAAADSLFAARRQLGDEALDLPDVKFVERDFVPYEAVAIGAGARYDAEHPIPELAIPAQGTYYSVTVGTFSTPQAVEIFRGAVPIFYQRTGSQRRYFAGLFRSYGEAAAAVRQLAEAGFRRPEAVRWRDGAYTNLAAAVVAAAGDFRIRIDTPAGELPDGARFALDRYAPGKEITRVGDTYYVGTFADRIHADEVLAALGAVDGTTPTLEDLAE